MPGNLHPLSCTLYPDDELARHGQKTSGGSGRHPGGKTWTAYLPPLLRASVPQKIIGDVLGHRSTESTNTYLKLATEDLRAVALDVPGSEVLS